MGLPYYTNYRSTNCLYVGGLVIFFALLGWESFVIFRYVGTNNECGLCRLGEFSLGILFWC